MAVFKRLGSNFASRSISPALFKDSVYFANQLGRDLRLKEMRQVCNVNKRYNVEGKLEQHG